MTVFRKLRMAAIMSVVVLLVVEIGGQLSVPGFDSVVTNAEARIGRPLTPFSVAGVARRTVRRCAVGVYYC